MNPLPVVAGVLFDSTGRILACQRPPGKHLAGKWEFPGGKIEPGESPSEALTRELREELGVEIEVLPCEPPLPSVEWTYDDPRSKPILLIPLLCRILSGTLHPAEHTALQWLDPASAETATALDWAAADLPILAALRERSPLS